MAPGTTVERLVDHLFDATPTSAFRDELAGWLTESRRFRTFIDANRDKVRKKLRGAADADARLDVRTELRVAHLLLAGGLDGVRGFQQRFLRLGAVIAWFEAGHGEARAARWINRSARIAVPEPAALAVLACLRAEPVS